MKGRVLALLALAVLAPPAWACIWDSDTLDDELRGLPEARALVVTGRWHRHGKAYYEHRVKTLPAHLESHPGDLAAYDDLAVAHERLGDRDAALAVINRKEKALKSHPDDEHRYRMLANRGTFLAHAGRFDEALVELGKAVELNPDAHFGRERYQILAIRFVGEARKDPALWGRANLLSHSGTWPEKGAPYTKAYLSFTDKAPLRPPPHGRLAKAVPWDEAHTAVAGMLRFGGLEGAELYRTLGGLYLVGGKSSWGDLHLAWWAYRRALARGHPAKAALEDSIAKIEDHWKGAGLGDVPTAGQFTRMEENGDLWLRNFHGAEAAALAEGKDPGDEEVLKALLAEADAKTGKAPGVGSASMLPSVRRLSGALREPWFLGIAAGLLLFGAALIAWVRWSHRRGLRKESEGGPRAA